ncbi:hypothetical protein AHF37_04199 [Paragonimus kellicotti]|nr:hypothetical protein AHF37_04199 [Paragonimus kellicotti]
MQPSNGNTQNVNRPLVVDKVDALLQQSASTVKHTRVLNQLARSVRKINQELSMPENGDHSSHSIRANRVTSQLSLIDQRPTSSESIRLNLPISTQPALRIPPTNEHQMCTSYSALSTLNSVEQLQPVRVRRWSGYQNPVPTRDSAVASATNTYQTQGFPTSSKLLSQSQQLHYPVKSSVPILSTWNGASGAQK